VYDVTWWHVLCSVCLSYRDSSEYQAREEEVLWGLCEWWWGDEGWWDWEDEGLDGMKSGGWCGMSQGWFCI